MPTPVSSFHQRQRRLVDLPPEILLHILHFLGSDFFRHDIHRLTICKQWHGLASQILFGELQLTTRSLTRLAQNQTALAGVQSQTAVLRLSISAGHEASTSDRDSEDDAEAGQRATTPVNLSLERLATTLQQNHRMRLLSLKATPHRSDEPGSPSGGYLMVKPLADLLSLRHLAALELDIAGCYPRNRNSDAGIHLCRSINMLLPTLRRLHCRMDRLCCALLELPPHSNTNTALRLEEIVINLSLSLSLSGLSDEITSYRYPSCCQSGGTFLELKESLVDQTTTLSRRLGNPRMVRILWHQLPSLNVYAWDAMAGRQIRLGPRDEDNSDADGDVWEAKEEHLDERDLFDSDSSTTPPEITF